MMKNCAGYGILTKKEQECGIRSPLPDPLLLVTFKTTVTLKSDWLFCFALPFSLAAKRMRFRAKNTAFCE